MVNYNENESLFFHVSANDYDSDGVLNSNDLCPYTNDTDWSNVDEGGCVQHEIEQATFYRQTSIDNLPDDLPCPEYSSAKKLILFFLAKFSNALGFSPSRSDINPCRKTIDKLFL